MKTIKITLLCSALCLFAFTGCLEHVGNSNSFSADNAVVNYSTDYPGVTFLDTPYGYYYGSIAAPDLNGKDYKKGDCLRVSCTIDFDNQPSSKYYTASNIGYEKIGKTSIIMLDAKSQIISQTIDELSVDSIGALSFMGSVYCIDNNLFMIFDQLDGKVQNYDYQLVYSDSLINNIPILYVCAKKSGISSATPLGDYRCQAFDLTSFLDIHEKSGHEFSFYLKYKKGVDAGKNVYTNFKKSSGEDTWTLSNLKFSDN